MNRTALQLTFHQWMIVVALATACALGDDQHLDPNTASSGPPSMVVISIDTLRSDRLPAYGYAEGKTPAIDRLVADGVLFERAYSPVPLTLPSHASLFSGLLPPDHGVRDNAGYRLRDEITTLAESLKKHGYETAAAVSSFTMRDETGLAQGFDVYDDRFAAQAQQTIGEIQRPGSETLSAVLPWLRTERDAPYFFFLHLYEPHTPYRPPPAIAQQHSSPYDGEIAAADAVVAELLDELEALGLYDPAVVVLLSDHGEGLGDHDEEEHGILLYREALQIPLIVKLPHSQRRGERVAVPVQLTDVTATLLELAGIEDLEHIEGTSLLDPPTSLRPIYAESYHPQLRFGWSALRSVVRGRHHYIQGAQPELYDLESDPQERINIASQQRRIYAQLRDELAEFEPRLEQPFAEEAATQQALASLGYLSSSRPRQERAADPRSRLHTLEPLREGIETLRDGDPGAAEIKLRQAVELDAGLLDGWQFLGMALALQGRHAEAFAAYEEAYRLSSGSPLLAEPMANAALRSGKVEEAIVLLGAAIEHTPDKLALRFTLAQVLLNSGQVSEALATVEQTLEVAPDNPDAHYQRGVVNMARRDLDAAEADLRRALDLAPDHVAALSDLAVLMMAEGRSSEARALLGRVLTIQPDNQAAKQHLRQLETS